MPKITTWSLSNLKQPLLDHSIFLANDVILFLVLFLNCSSLFQERYAIPYEEKYHKPPAENKQQNK